MPLSECGREKGNQNQELVPFSECGRRIAAKRSGWKASCKNTGRIVAIRMLNAIYSVEKL
jgi:hypothetical protein